MFAMIDVRCPGTRKGTKVPCNRLTAVVSDDFRGDFSTRCRRCDNDFGLGHAPPIRLTCSCGKWLASGGIEQGFIQMVCPKEKALVRLTPAGAFHVEPPTAEAIVPPKPPVRKPRETLPGPSRSMRPEDLVALIEERWELLRWDRARRSSEIAVGLRFDVFNRDGFRCVYCGRGPSQGSFLEADHVIPRSAGGLDTLGNLVTACWDCNRGKSAKRINPLDSENPAA